MSRKVFFPFIFGVLPLLLLIVGCGDSGSQASGGGATVETGSLSKAQFVKKANAICEAGQQKTGEQITTYLRQHKIQVSGDLSKDAASEIVSGIMTPTLRQEAAQIGALGAPEADKAKVVAIVEAIESGSDHAEKNPSNAVTRNELIPAASRLAKSYGMLTCAFIWT